VTILKRQYAKETGMPLLLALIMLSSYSFATVTIGKVDCPVQFEGRVEEIIESVGSKQAFSTQSVVFKNQHTIKGDVGEQVAVEMLEYGPFKIEHGEDYRVQLREGRVCWVEEI
jgi:hypothetical protein